jgi:hypothetical protein
MASLSVLTLKEGILPIISSFNPEDLRTVKVEHRFTDNSNAMAPVSRHEKAVLPICNDPSNKELFIYVIDQFKDACEPERLNLHSGMLRYNKFREVVEGDLKISWNDLCSNRRADNNNAGQANYSILSFDQDLLTLLRLYLAPTSYEDQKEYMRSATKPYNMSCEALGSRLRVISNLSRYLPGSNGLPLYTDNNQAKRAYYQMMPSPWKVKFAESGFELDGDYSYFSLIRFMSIQATISDKKSSRTSTVSGNKRPFGNSGRGRGRGHSGGRGRGRGRFGNYFSQGTYGGYSGYSYPPAQPRYSPPSAGSSQYTPRAQPPSYSGGRSGSGRGASPSPRPYSSGGRIPPRNYGGNYQRPRGPPQIPNFYVDHSRRGHSNDQYYGEHYFGDSAAPSAGEQYDPTYEEQYYQHDTYHAPQDQYYDERETGVAHAGETYYEEQAEAETGETNESSEVHWLDEFTS